MGRRRKKTAKMTKYEQGEVFHIHKDVFDGKRWSTAMCGMQVRFGEQDGRWKWCKKCTAALNSEISEIRKKAKQKPTTWYKYVAWPLRKTKVTITHIYEQKFEPPMITEEKHVTESQESIVGS